MLEHDALEAVRNWQLLDTISWISAMGRTELTAPIAIVTAVVLWRHHRRLGGAYVAAVAIGLLTNVVMKFVTDVPRPWAPATDTALDSYPSGHMIQAVILAGMFPIAVAAMTGRVWLGRIVAVVLASSAVGVGFVRLYLNSHWPTDVIGGGLIGLAIVIAARMSVDRDSSEKEQT